MASHLDRTPADDPFAELAGDACDLLALAIGARHCGVITLEGRIPAPDRLPAEAPQDGAADGPLAPAGADPGRSAEEAQPVCAASTAFRRLPPALQSDTIAAVSQAMARMEFAPDAAPSSQLVTICVDREVGEAAVALLFAETDTVVFAVPPLGASPPPVEEFRRSALLALGLVQRMLALGEERRALWRSHRLLRNVEELAGIGGWELSLQTAELAFSDELYAIYGLPPRTPVSLEETLQLYAASARENIARDMERAVAEGGGLDVTAPVRTPAGEERIVRTRGRTRMERSGHILYGIAQDVTEELAADKSRWWAANHDPVTGLPNRLLFEDRLEVAARAADRDGRSFALILIEITDQARLEEHAGFTVPDKHMMEVASRLSSVTRGSDAIARLSMSEFALILPDVGDAEGFRPAMDRLLREFRAVASADVEEAGIALCAGVAFYPRNASAAGTVMRAARSALARAAQSPDAPVALYEEALIDETARPPRTVLARARESLGRDEFVPYYQPQVDLATLTVSGVEALVRWRAEDGTLDAKDFAQALDDYEVGSAIGRAVLDAVIADVARLRAGSERRLRVSVNASRTEVLRNDFLDTFLQKARAGNLTPCDFIIEITEDVIIGVDDRTLHDKASYLVNAGVKFSLDDFGTGYASLIHISSFPIDQIKIDKQFIRGIEKDRAKRAIVAGILQIAHAMGLNVIAEGVETKDQEEILRDMGCHHAQGYLYALPMPFAQFADMLERSI